METLTHATELWAVTGLPTVVFASKDAAERAARDAYRSELPDRRYARIYYVGLYGTPTALQELATKIVSAAYPEDPNVREITP